MRIGFHIGQIHGANIGGGHTFQISVIEALQQTTTEHEFYFYYRSNTNVFNNTPTLRFINMQFIAAPNNPQYLFNELVIRDKIELVYYLAPFFEDTVMPFIFTVWDLAHRKLSFFPEVSVTGWAFSERERHYQNIIPRALYTVIGNQTGKQQVCRYYGMDAERVAVIPLPTSNYIGRTAEDRQILTQYNLTPQKYLFYPAQFWPHKNHIRLIKAMRTLKKSGFKLALSGSDVGNRRYIEQKIHEYALQDVVCLLGFVSNAEIVALYKNAFALTFASYFGPDNIPPLEAMALQCPVICAQYCGAHEQLGDAALYFDPQAESTLIAQIEKLHDPSLRQTLITAGVKLAQERGVENYVAEMLKLIATFAPLRECWSRDELYIHT